MPPTFTVTSSELNMSGSILKYMSRGMFSRWFQIHSNRQRTLIITSSKFFSSQNIKYSWREDRTLTYFVLSKQLQQITSLVLRTDWDCLAVLNVKCTSSKLITPNHWLSGMGIPEEASPVRRSTDSPSSLGVLRSYILSPSA